MYKYGAPPYLNIFLHQCYYNNNTDGLHIGMWLKILHVEKSPHEIVPQIYG